MKIAHVLNHFLPKHIAGTEVYAFNLGKALKAKNHKVIFIVPNYHCKSNLEYKVEDMRVIKYAEPSVVDKSIQMGKRTPDGLKHFVEILENEKPDIVHFHEISGSNGITVHHVIAAKNKGFSTIMTLHLARYTTTVVSGTHPTNIFNNRMGALDFYASKGLALIPSRLLYGIGVLLKSFRIDLSGMGSPGTALSIPIIVDRQKKDFEKLFLSSDAIVTVARWYRNLLVQEVFSEPELLFIEQGIDTSSLKKKDLATAESKTTLRLVFLGRISHFKGVKELISIAKDIRGISLDVYGDFGEDSKYIRECKDLVANTDNVILKGALKIEEVIATLSKYDLLILPSTIHEMSPLVIREAFAAGIPVLSSDNEGAKEQIKEGKDGWFFKMNDWGDLHRKLTWLVQNFEKVKKTRQFPPVRTFDEVGHEYEIIYMNIIKDKPVEKNG